jgi:hypothetical protein
VSGPRAQYGSAGNNQGADPYGRVKRKHRRRHVGANKGNRVQRGHPDARVCLNVRALALA